MDLDTKKLQGLYDSDESYREFFDHFAAKKRPRYVVTVDRVEDQIDRSRKEIVEIFKTLEALDAGTFIVGRRGQISRFAWSRNPIGVAKAAAGEPFDLEEVDVIEPDADVLALEDDEDELVAHSFRLRKGMNVTFELPDDISSEEVERLSTFLRSLPLG